STPVVDQRPTTPNHHTRSSDAPHLTLHGTPTRVVSLIDRLPERTVVSPLPLDETSQPGRPSWDPFSRSMQKLSEGRFHEDSYMSTCIANRCRTDRRLLAQLRSRKECS